MDRARKRGQRDGHSGRGVDGDQVVFRRLARFEVSGGARHSCRGGDAPDVLGRRPAAAPDEPRSYADHAARVHAEVLRRRHVDHALVDAARLAGVRRRKDRQPDRHHLAHGREDAHRTVRAVHADDARAPLPGEAGDLVSLRSLGHAAVFVERRARDHGYAPLGRLDRGFDGGSQLGRLPDRLDDQGVDPRIEQRSRLLEERRLDLREVLRGRVAPDSPRKYPLGPMAPMTYACPPAASRAMRAPAALSSLDARRQPVLFEAHALAPNVLVSMTCAPARTKSSCTLRDELRTRNVELLEARAVQHAALVEQRSHRAVDDEHPRAHGVDQRALCGKSPRIRRS